MELMLERALRAEALGFDEFWVTEHHNPEAHHSAPLVAITYLASRTTTLRVGSGGILLPYVSPYRVAEDFFALHSLFPGRIELGVGPGPGTYPEAVRAILDRAPSEPPQGEYHQKARRLASYLRRETPEGFEGLEPTPPVEAKAPPLTILGVSKRAVDLAIELDASFTYGFFIADPDPLYSRAHEILSDFRARRRSAGQRAGVAFMALAGRNEAQAAEWERVNRGTGSRGHLFVGSVKQVRTEFEELRAALQPDLALLGMSPGVPHAHQMLSIEGLAKALLPGQSRKQAPEPPLAVARTQESMT